MYGKRFIAALTFLAVAEIDVNAYGHYGGYGGYDDEEDVFILAAEDYIPAPEYSLDMDYAVEVPIPEGDDWDVMYAYFGLEMVEDDSDVWDWANDLASSDYRTPTGYVMRGEIEFYEDSEEPLSGIGLIQDIDDEGIMAVYEFEETDPFSTLYFTHDDIEDDGDFEEEPEFLDGEEVDEGFGNGDEWGQEVVDVNSWSIYSYNDEGDAAGDEWSDGDYTVFYVEGGMGEYSGFSTDIYLEYMGAKQLLATTATASLLFALM